MKLVHSPAYHIDIGLHVFPTAKYDLVRAALVAGGVVSPADLVEPAPASWDDLALVHTPEYLRKVRCGELSFAEVAQLELSWDPDIVEGFRLMTGGTILTARLALRDRIAVHIGGGLHHGFPDHGEGFCLFNDVAVAIRVLQRNRVVERVAVIDCDVHHGNGTAAIFHGDSSVFTFSMHQEHNYPVVKPPGTLDISLPDGTRDKAYLSELDHALPLILGSRPEIMIYLAGADPYYDDQLGGLSLTRDGLRHRDRLVFQACRAGHVPVAVTLAGGYARRIEDTVAIHVATVEEASELARELTM